MNQLTLLSKKMHSERLDVLKDNQEHVANGGDQWSDSDSDEVKDIGNENANEIIDDDGDGDYIEENSDDEWDRQQKLFAKLGPKLHNGKKLTEDEMKEFGIDDDGSDSDDSDYEYAGGDMSLYDSRLDDIDELKTLKETLV